jgi:hypothetical protein
LAGNFGKGPVLELHGATVAFDGRPVTGKNQEERLASLRQLVASPQNAAATLYVAASAGVDMRTLQTYLAALPESYDLRLTFARPASPPSPQAPAEDSVDSAHAEKLLLERDPTARRQIAAEGYREYSECAAVDAAAAAHHATPESTRWPALKRAMLEAVPQCPCSDINPDGLRQLLVAEQRAGNVALGSMPARFLKDVRCRASMPLRTVQQVLGDVENFEAEFSGNWDETGVRFEEVVTNDRLLNYLCTAMPGELFESVSAEFATVFVRNMNSSACQAYRLEPVARGAVFGTFRSLETPTTDVPHGSFHYRLGGNDIRVFGPVTKDSRPTDDGPWACDKDLKLISSDAQSLAVDGGGQIYLTKQSCETAPRTSSFSSCVFDPTSSPTPAEAPVGPNLPATLTP